ncbi:MAG: MarR family winged helix-turn-helix transcriptional regulator [Hyphomicrobiales bacterium]|nr:MarR family winged helix-turn-helix transcriptional regulator [Hyphomicrobiales bacterium]MDE2114077.1 winged helix-turn-helix transcriptional regulator [Hyphomicrobiales bacterium]
MTGSNDPSQILRAWTRLVRVHRAIAGETESRLKGAHLPPLLWHDVLLEIEHAQDQQLRPRDIEARLQIAQYNLSRMIEKMIAAGLVHRIACEEDGRGYWIKLDAAGAKLRAAMWAVHAQVLADKMEPFLDGDSARKMAKQLGKLLPHLNG